MTRLALSNMRIVVKASLPVGLLLAALACLCSFAVTRMTQIADTYAGVVERDVAAAQAAMTVELDLARYGAIANRIVSESSMSELDALEKQTKAMAAALPDHLRTLTALMPAAQARSAAVQARFDRAFEATDDLITKTFGSQQDQALKIAREQVDPALAEAGRLLAAIVTEADDTVRRATADAASSVGTARRTTLAVALGVAAAAVLLAWLILQGGVARPVVALARTMERLAAGDEAAPIAGTGRRDEVGRMARAVQVFRDNLIRTRALEAETAEARLGAEEQRRTGMRRMADRFEAAVSSVVAAVSARAGEMQAAARSMTATATETAGQSAAAAAAAEDAAANVGTVAAAAEQLGSSVQEIGRQVSGSADLAQAAVGEAEQTARLVQQLSATVARIGDVATMISGIASQTNPLALNATIEAARAGEAGRGFAVVAAEVKELATQTTRATEEIGGQIAQIQAATGQAVTAIGGIGTRIREISGVAASIAAAVEQQGAATQEIVRNVAQAATGAGAVTSNVGGVALAAEATGTAAAQVLDSASALSRQSEHLSQEVARFLDSVRAA